MILSSKVTSVILIFRNKTQNVGRPVVDMIKACSRGRGGKKKERKGGVLNSFGCRRAEDPLLQLCFELLLNKIGDQG